MKVCIALFSLVAVGLTGYAALSAGSAEAASAGSLRRVRGSRIAFTRLVTDVGDPLQDFRLHAEIWIMNGDGTPTDAVDEQHDRRPRRDLGAGRKDDRVLRDPVRGP